LREAIRLLLVVDSLEVGGAERHVVDLTVALSRKGHEVALACSVAGELSDALHGTNVQVRPLLDRLVKRRVSVAYARGLRRLVGEQRFDLVHAHIYASAAARDSPTEQHRDPGAKELRHELEEKTLVVGHVVRKVDALGPGPRVDAHLRGRQISPQRRPVHRQPVPFLRGTWVNRSRPPRPASSKTRP
jgi:hypothetical protein